MNRLSHTYVGHLETTGDYSVKALCTAYIGTDKTPLLYSFVGTQEIVRAIKAHIFTGSKVIIRRPGRMTMHCINKDEKFENLSTKVIEQNGKHHVIMTNERLREGYQDPETYVQIVNEQDPSVEVFERVKKLIGEPLLEEWYPALWMHMKAAQMVMPVTHTHGLMVYRVIVDDKFKSLITSALKMGLVPSITQVYNMRHGGQ